MNTFEAAGDAMLQSHEGSRQIAQAMLAGLKALARRVSAYLSAGIQLGNGSHRMP
jgi:hypothetical protein